MMAVSQAAALRLQQEAERNYREAREAAAAARLRMMETFRFDVWRDGMLRRMIAREREVMDWGDKQHRFFAARGADEAEPVDIAALMRPPPVSFTTMRLHMDRMAMIVREAPAGSMDLWHDATVMGRGGHWLEGWRFRHLNTVIDLTVPFDTEVLE